MIDSSSSSSARPATDKQIRLAHALEIEVTGTETVEEMSLKITLHFDPEYARLTDDQCLADAQHFKVFGTPKSRRDEILWGITRAVSAPGRELDMARWYVYRVYRSQRQAWTRKALELSLDGDLRQMAELLLQDRLSRESMLREVQRSNLDKFLATRPLEEYGAHRVASTRTSAFKYARQLLAGQGYIHGTLRAA